MTDVLLTYAWEIVILCVKKFERSWPGKSQLLIHLGSEWGSSQGYSHNVERYTSHYLTRSVYR